MLKKPQSTLTVDEESPCPRGLANGLWNGRPIMPLDEVRDGVGEEGAAEEVRQEMKPIHFRRSWPAGDR